MWSKSFLGGSDGKESACSAWYLGLIPGLGRSPGEGNGNPFLKNPWRDTVHGIMKSQTWLSDQHTVESFSLGNESEVDIFLEFPCFLYDPVNVDNLISGSSAFSKPRLYIWNSLVHVLLKPGLENFEHYFASMWNAKECSNYWTIALISKKGYAQNPSS